MNLPTVLKTGIELTFLSEDLRDYPWLGQPVRCYKLGEPIAKGAFGVAYHSYPCDQHGNGIQHESLPELVVKVPIIQREGRTDDEIRARLDYIRRKNIQDFFHIRKRLLGCSHANPVIDLASLSDGIFELQATVQPFLQHSIDLNEWLFISRLRQERARLPASGSHWYGIADRSKWIEVALAIARAISDLHRRRVTHADIHPGNVFISLKPPVFATIIDFGEAFVATPDRNSRQRNPNPYLAPERLGPRFLLSEQVDVYSFGILMLYLATGVEKQLSAELPPGSYRTVVFDEIRKHNPALIGDEPRILDVIGRSIARDPADRPRMADICEDLENIGAALNPAFSRQRPNLSTTLEQLSTTIKSAQGHQSPLLLDLLERHVRDLANSVAGLETEMVELNGTRDQLLRVMVSLFGHLSGGDSWTAATTLAVWQRSALGLEGTYASANIRAVKRGVAVRRAFVISVEEIGRDFADNLRIMLRNSSDSKLNQLGEQLDRAIAEYDSTCNRLDYPHLKPEVTKWHRERFVYLTQFIHRFVVDWELGAFIAKDEKIDIATSPGLFLGICMVSTLDKVGEIREDNPASLMHFAGEQEDTKKWFLVSTEARGRRESRENVEKPHLLGVRVYRSVQGIPHDRIEFLQRLINNHSVNVGLDTFQLSDIARAADSAIRQNVKL